MNSKKISLERDLVVGIIFSGLGIYMSISTGLEKGIYPFLIFLLLVLFGVLTVLQSLLKPANNLLEAVSLRELLLILSLFVSPALIGLLGFYTAGFLGIFIISLIISPNRELKTIVGLILFCLAVVVVTYLIFTVGLRIRCPRGALLLI